MARLTAWYVGLMWVMTWGFWQAGFHTPMSFAVSLVGCTGLALILSAAVCSLKEWR